MAIVLSCPNANSQGQIHPGQKWADNNGIHVNAHGGNVIQSGQVWYWYGERRNEHYKGGAMHGVSVYRSENLVDWTDCGLALAVSDEQGHEIERGCLMERPKVVYNPKTKLYVMLFHHELKGRGYDAARVGFAVSESPVGPFTFLKSLRPNAGQWPSDWTEAQISRAKSLQISDYSKWWTPEWTQAIGEGLFLARDLEGGQMSRDMTVYVDDDGRAYHIFSSEDNLTLHIAELTDDFLDYTGRYVRVAPAGHNEAPTILKRGDRYWMITSGCTGWEPNEARMFWADNIMGPWTQVPSPFRGENAKRSFNTQGTYILHLPSTGKFVYMADRWQPNSLSESPHVWLLIDFDADGTPVLVWRDSWEIRPTYVPSRRDV